MKQGKPIAQRKTDEAKALGYTRGEEIFNAVTHGVGALLSAAGCALLVVFAAIRHDAWAVVSAAIYGATLILLYLTSTLYHSFTGQRSKSTLRILDHCVIFLLIAGTYTPYVLVTLRSTVGWWVFSVVWGTAILGIVLNAINMRRFRVFSMICYLAMGWVILIAIKPLMAALAPGGVILLISGGVMYTAGIIFYAMKRFRYMHSIWHLFVLAGSILHFLSVLLYVVM
ncbi:MAG: hemolysin III family protein [Eubacteriales bacterium]|nr:hemolysin III family protein [Eubacteriales bacterium]